MGSGLSMFEGKIGQAFRSFTSKPRTGFYLTCVTKSFSIEKDRKNHGKPSYRTS